MEKKRKKKKEEELVKTPQAKTLTAIVIYTLTEATVSERNLHFFLKKKN